MNASRFEDHQVAGFFEFVNTMEMQRYARGDGQVEHGFFAFALDARSGRAIGILPLAGAGENAATDAVRMMLEHGFEAAAIAHEAFDALVVSVYRPGEPAARWAREIVTDNDGRRRLGDVLIDTIASASAA